MAQLSTNPSNGDHSYRRVDLPTSLSLLARLRVRDPAGWRDCLTLYAPLLLRWCLRQGLTEADAADVAQEVFRIVAENVVQFHKDELSGSFRGWLCRITHREIAAFRRRQGPVVPAGGTDAQLRLTEVPDTPCDSPDDGDVAQETRYLYKKAVAAARSEFPDRMWQMFWRTAVDGNPAPNVAQEFGTTSAAVRQAKSRVLRRLKQLVGDLPD
jgi:RNA polymerase sigma-70 factor (ECF subfamily)